MPKYRRGPYKKTRAKTGSSSDEDLSRGASPSSRGEQDAEAVRAASQGPPPETPSPPSSLSVGADIPDEEKLLSAKIVQAAFLLLSLVLGPEWRMDDSYLPYIGTEAALSARKRLPTWAREPEVQLGVKCVPHVATAYATWDARKKAERARLEQLIRRAYATTGPGTAPTPEGPGGVRGRAENPDLRNKRDGQDEPVTVIGTGITASPGP